MAKILAIDDEKQILIIIKKALEKEGHLVDIFTNSNMLTINDYLKYDLIILDIMMPDIDGFTLCKNIRNKVDCPILFLSAKTLENDIVTGLSIGGDDYIIKPFGIKELRARVNAHLRREKREKQNGFIISNLRFNMLNKTISYNEHKIDFTKSEYEICEYLAVNHGQVFSKEKIYEKIYGYDGESDITSIVEHIKNIRAKLKKHNINPIETVWGIGYKWV